MKKFLISSCLLVTCVAPAMAQQQQQHMFEFNADSILQGVISFDKSKFRGSNVSDDVELDLMLNYAYTVTDSMQLGSRINYLKSSSVADSENYGLEVGAIYNFRPDFKTSPYVSGYIGMQWNNIYGGVGSARDEVMGLTVAAGRRFTLVEYGLAHVVWSPEIAVEFLNSTTNESLDYSQSLQFRVLQFSVFF